MANQNVIIKLSIYANKTDFKVNIRTLKIFKYHETLENIKYEK